MPPDNIASLITVQRARLANHCGESCFCDLHSLSVFKSTCLDSLTKALTGPGYSFMAV